MLTSIQSTFKACPANSCHEGLKTPGAIYVASMVRINGLQQYRDSCSCDLVRLQVRPEKIHVIIGSDGKKVKSILDETTVDAIDTEEDMTVRSVQSLVCDQFSILDIIFTSASYL